MTGVSTTIATGVLVALVVAAPAWSQVDPRVLRERNQILQQQDIARMNSLAAQRELSAAQSRYDTQLTLRMLDQSLRPTTEPTLRPAVTPLPRGPSIDDMAADAERMDRMTDARLAAGNARLRDITPAR